MPPYAVALDGRCDEHYDEGNGKWCYVKGGVTCANAFAAEELVGAAWIDCGFCDHANGKMTSLDPSLGVQASATFERLSRPSRH